MKKINYIFGVVGVFLLFSMFVSTVQATHSWGGYHWARTANPFNLKLGNNLTSAWESYLDTTSSDWTKSVVLDTSVVQGTALRYKSPNRDCSPTSGMVEICNKTYGNTGWLGIAQIWITGGTHIAQGVVKVNDTYFNTTKYNTPAWRNLVMCQEAGHTFGLGHQDEIFDNPNLGTCMDYTSDPDGTLANPDQSNNEHPNAHDYAQLDGTIYIHTDGTTTVSTSTSAKGANSANRIGANVDNPSDWGKAIKKDAKGRDSVFEKDLGNGKKVLTHVFWAE